MGLAETHVDITVGVSAMAEFPPPMGEGGLARKVGQCSGSAECRQPSAGGQGCPLNIFPTPFLARKGQG